RRPAQQVDVRRHEHGRITLLSECFGIERDAPARNTEFNHRCGYAMDRCVLQSLPRRRDDLAVDRIDVATRELGFEAEDCTIGPDLATRTVQAAEPLTQRIERRCL